jgi:hypothetical protein
MSLRITIKNRLQQNDSYDLECNIAGKVVVRGNLEINSSIFLWSFIRL